MADDSAGDRFEEARRRARRRRQGYAACVLAAAFGLTAALVGVDRGGGGGGKSSDSGGSSRGVFRDRVSVSPRALVEGGLTTVGLPSRDGQAPPGWYQFSRIGSGGRLEPLLRCPGQAGWCGEVLSLAWTRDGERVAFSVTSFGGTAVFNGLHIVSLRTRQDVSLVTPETNEATGLAWSPDGSQLAYRSGSSLYLMDAATFHARRLRTHTSGDSDSSPSWSADGERLVFASARNGHTSLYVINTDGSHRHLIATRGTEPAWQPDGRVIAYHSRCGGIKLLTPSGTDITRRWSGGGCTAIGIGGTPIWSPDSKQIAIGAPHSFVPGIYSWTQTVGT